MAIKKIKLLIIDDAKFLGDKIARYLLEYQKIIIVGHALNGTQAIELIKEKKPDIILLDIQMPGLNGFDVLLWLREQKLNIKVIVMTNYLENIYRQKSFELGAHFFIDKVNEFDKLPEIIKSC